MKTFTIIACIFSVFFWYISLIACPTCVGTINEKSPPFFFDSCYQSNIQTTQQPIMQTEDQELPEEKEQ